MATEPNFQVPPVGLGSYLQGILPEDIAAAAGAFSMALQQMKNIQNADFEKFSQVASSIEVVNTNLNLVNGTDVPVNLPKTAENTKILALGSGPHGTYVVSDFFGCMSGLPYSWRELQNLINQASTTKLYNIYTELFLAVTWEGAVVAVVAETRQVEISPGPPPVYQTEYRVGGFSIINKGGGYGRGTASNPIITTSNGGSGIGIVGRNDKDCQSLNGKSYGRLTGATVTSAGSWVLSPPTITSIQYPPTATLPVLASGSKSTGGSNTAYSTVGWPSPMNTVVQAYIDQANAEVKFISQSKQKIVERLNTVFNYHGTQLEIEQRCRYLALDPVPLPDRNRWMSQYPMTPSNWVDSLSVYAQSTRPHMHAQTIEAISNLKNVCGQSIVATMRQERNINRLEKIAQSLDNVIPGKIKTELEKPLTANGTMPVGKKNSGIDVKNINGNPKDPTTTYTAPATLVQQLNIPPTSGGQTRNINPVIIAPKPSGYFDPNTNRYILVSKTTPIDESAPVQKILNVQNIAPNTNTNLLGPAGDGTGPAVPAKTAAITDPAIIQSGIANTSKPLLQNQPGVVTPPGVVIPTPLSLIPIEPIAVVATGAIVPIGQGQILDQGQPVFPGSFAGSEAVDILPPNLDATYTSATLLPSIPTVDEAIDEVIKCNCDCWVD